MKKGEVKLWQALLMDGIGCLTYFIPVLGEFADILWAPFSAWMFYRMFGGRMGRIGGIINLIEEGLPYLDIIPTFTIAWFLRRFIDKNTD